MGRFVQFLSLVLPLVCLLSAPAAQSQFSLSTAPVEPDSTLQQIEHCFLKGDSVVLLNLAAESIDIALFGEGATYSRSQATRVLQDFFRRYPPESVILREEVASDDRRSLVGEYHPSGAAEPSTVFVRLRARGGQWEIRSIRVE